MKTKNDYSDWLRAVERMESGATLKEAVKADVSLVHGRTHVQRPKRITQVSAGQIKAIRRD